MSTLRFTHLADRLFGQPLLLHPGKLRTIVAVLAPRMGLPMPSAEWGDEDDTPAVAQPPAAQPAGVAVISVHGATVLRNAPGAMSGMRSYEDIRAEFDGAMSRSDVSGIVLHLDSPGGEVAGAFDLADHIYAARGTKPIVALVSERALSAGYLLASAAERIILSRTSCVGSIGVVCVHLDVTAADTASGMKYTPIYAGARKIDGWAHAPLSDRAAQDAQANVDTVYEMFCGTIARNMGLKPEVIRGTEAGSYFGQAALDVGLAHQVGLLKDALKLAALRSGARINHSRKEAAMAMETPSGTAPGETENIEREGEREQQGSGAEAAPPPATETATPSTSPAPEQAAAEARQAGFEVAMAQVSEVMDLCAIANRPDLAAGFIRDRRSVADVRQTLLAARAEAADREPVHSHAPSNSGAKPYDQLKAASDQLRRDKPSMSDAQAFRQACKANPALYQAYRAEIRN